MKGIPSKHESVLASARASGRRRNDMLRRLVRVVGADAGEYSIGEIACRLSCDPARASVMVSIARRDTAGQVTWNKLSQLHASRAK